MARPSFIKSLFGSLKGIALASVFSLLAACGGSNGGSDNDNKSTDSTAPVITLNGKSSIQLEAGSEYIEPGATGEDDVDGDVSVSINGSVDINKLGEYTLTYSAVDNSGNSASVSRAVSVVDTTPPIITLNGESVIEVEAGTEYEDKGATAEDSFDHEVIVIVEGDVDPQRLGFYTLTYTATDASKNSKSITRTISVVDTTPPNISLIGEHSVLVEAGSEYQEQGATAKDYIDGVLNIKVEGEVDTSSLGEYIVTYTSTDNSNNTQSKTRSVTVIDTTPPSITLSGDTVIELVVGKDYQELGATALDYIDGNVSVSITGNVDSNTLGEYIVTYTSIDTSGNSTSVSRTVSVIGKPPFITVWKTDNSGKTNPNQIEINTNDDSNFKVDWGDGTIETGLSGTVIHTYDTPGVYTVKMSGEFSRFFFPEDNLDNGKLLSVEQWGAIEWSSMQQAFYGARNMVLNAQGSPNLSLVTNMDSMFYGAREFNSDINHWDVSNVTSMASLFNGAVSFNQDLDQWDVSNVDNMSSMFERAGSFNKDISGWQVSNVTDMSYMFKSANSFDQNLNDWNVSKVTNMREMFLGAIRFSGDIGDWIVSRVVDMGHMFYFSINFNSDISQWDVSNVKNMSGMFGDATKFNADISGWKVDNVTDMSFMFSNAKAFNSNLEYWNVSKVTNMAEMFASAHLFNSNLTDWDVQNVKDMSFLFYEAKNFNGNIEMWKVSNVTDMSAMFAHTELFNRDLSSWNVSNVTDMETMFYRASKFNKDISNWDIKNVVSMREMFSYSGLSSEIYDNILNSWAALPTLQEGVSFGVRDIKYSSNAESARSILIGTYRWNILDGGLAASE